MSNSSVNPCADTKARLIQVREKRAAAAAKAGLPPASNTGGKSPNVSGRVQAATIDTLTFTIPLPFLCPSLEVAVLQDDEAIAAAVTREFLAPLGLQVGLSTGRRINGYRDSAPLEFIGADPDSNGSINAGYCAWGGNMNKADQETLCVYLTGQACESVNLLDAERDGAVWAGLAAALEAKEAKITRLDVAYDDLNGTYGGVAASVGWYKQGLYSTGGRPPSVSQCGDWINGHGRTLYVGRRENGKLIRIYEKGHQLGADDSPWTRYELELRSRDRVIPLDALLDPSGVLAGAAPCLSFVLQVEPVKIKTVVKAKLRVTLDHLQKHCAIAYGRLINAFSGVGMTPEQIVTALSVDGLPRRLYVPPALFAQPDAA